VSVVEEFTAALLRVGAQELPEEVAHETRRCLLNVLGTTIGASQARETRALVETGARLGAGEVAMPGRHEGLDRLWAACAVGFAGHFDDYDDTHLETVIHPGAATLGAIWPLALIHDSSGADVLRAMALGVESQLRVGIAMSPSHYDLGWHITGTCGVIGAAVAAGVLLGSDGATHARALEIAAHLAVGQREAFGTPIKPFHAGKAASNGLLAALLAAEGAPGSPGVLEGGGGYFSALSDELHLELLSASDVERRFVLLDNTYKPFPCGIVAHPAIEAAIGLHPQLGPDGAAAIAEVDVHCNPLVVELMGRPSASTGLEARFCALHGVAVGLLEGAGGLAQFSDERATDPVVDSLRRRSTLRPDPAIGRESARVVVRTSDGQALESHVAAAAGSSERPLTDQQLLEKFRALVEPVLPGRADAIADAVRGLGRTTSMREIEAAMR
jgi:2-methylcitrate dehydratase PrpD